MDTTGPHSSSGNSSSDSDSNTQNMRSLLDISPLRATPGSNAEELMRREIPERQEKSSMDEEDEKEHPQYQTERARLDSFRHWKYDVVISHKVLVKVGLFYDGIADNVTCFFCGLGLRNWCPGDDPVERHRELLNFCPILKMWDENPPEPSLGNILENTQEGPNGNNPLMVN